MHWSEIACAGIIGLPFLVLLEIRARFEITDFLYAGTAILTFGAVIAVFFHLRYLRHWQRYKPYVPK